MPLKVVLRPGETMVVNGAVIGAGDRTATIFLHNRAQFLRGRDMLRAEEVDGPERALYYAIQCSYLGSDGALSVEAALAAARAARPEAADVLDRVRALVAEGRAYEALRLCASLFRPKP
ncbi:MAG: flagellar biosynthesis repressor FlbT [Elioraea sp.]|nr:flagellar biosynthesis repressor FlbT [Elioraea sp.]MDW8445397.1 flagellar biosynthesis repressor FlbT [Acetobacteraceae bacterium]